MNTEEYNEIKDILHKQDVKLERIDEKLTDYKQIRADSTEALQLSKENQCDIVTIKDTIKYLSRTITTAIIGGVIGIIILFIKIGIGLK